MRLTNSWHSPSALNFPTRKSFNNSSISIAKKSGWEMDQMFVMWWPWQWNYFQKMANGLLSYQNVSVFSEIWFDLDGRDDDVKWVCRKFDDVMHEHPDFSPFFHAPIHQFNNFISSNHDFLIYFLQQQTTTAASCYS